MDHPVRLTEDLGSNLKFCLRWFDATLWFILQPRLELEFEVRLDGAHAGAKAETHIDAEI